jgi:folate-binding protein YgfZ
MPSALLEDRGVIRVAGEEARAFLQGLFTCDMDKVAPGKAAYGALLTPQGKIICDFLISETDGGFFADCPLALAPDLTKRLRFYKLRAKIDVEDLSATRGVVARWGEALGRTLDPRDPALGSREIVARDGATAPSALASYEAHRIALGVPKGGVDFAYGDAFPHEANMDLLHGVDFKKGCYVGQEVVSRVEHRGSARKRIARVKFDGQPPPAGAPLLAGDVEIGLMGSATIGMGLAMVRVDRARDAIDAGLAITVDGRAATLALPAARV